MNLFKYFSSIALFVSCTFTAQASEDIDIKVLEKIRSKLLLAKPTFPLGKISKSAIPNLYKMTMPNKSTIYISSEGDYLITGEMFKVNNNEFVSVDTPTIEQQRLDLLATIPKAEMIIYPANQSPKSFIYVFTDVDCSYCTKLHKEIPALQQQGVEVRYIGYPREGLYTPAHSKLSSAWCSASPKEMLPRLQNGEYPELEDCDYDPIIKQWAIGNQIGLNGRTPAIVTSSGKLLFGYHPAERLMTILVNN